MSYFSFFSHFKIKEYLSNAILKNVIIVGLITLLIKIIAFYKETIIAATFGLSRVLDTFLIAVLLPTFIQSVFLNSLKHLFIPNYIAFAKEKKSKGNFQSFIFLVTTILCVFSIGLSYVAIDFLLEYIYPNRSEAYYSLVKNQLIIILPSIVLWGYCSIITGLYEIHNKFLISTIYGLFPLLTMVVFLLFFKDFFGDMVLAYGTTFGTVVGFIFLLTYNLKYRLVIFRRPQINDGVREMLKQLPPKVSSSFLSSMNNFIDQFFAGSLAIGSIAALNYGNRIPAFGITIIIMSLGNVLLPHFSRLVNENLLSAYNYLFKVLKIVFTVSLFGVVIVFFISEELIILWLERDEFTRDDSLTVASIQKILLLNVPFYLSTLIIVKFLTSINKNHFMAWISFFNLLVNITLNFILMKYYGVYGLAISTTAVLIISNVGYFMFTFQQYKKIQR